MIISDTPDPANLTIAIAERQLAMLGDLALMSMEVSRGYAAAALASAHAVEVILADEHWQPETGRARALAGARDAADGFQKVSRVLRLTLRLEMTTAETLSDLRAGLVPVGRAPVRARMDAGGPPADPEAAWDGLDDESPEADRKDNESERLFEFDRPDRLPHRSFREVVDGLCADIGVTADWTKWSVHRPALKYEPLAPRPPSGGECRPWNADRRSDAADGADRAEHPPP